MAGAAVPYICDFTDSQRQAFVKLEQEIKKKWDITLRWDSKVPEKDKWLLKFFTFRGLDRGEIYKDLEECEKQFEEINVEMQKIRSGTNVSQQQIQCIREKFEKVLTNMKTLNNDTDSRSIYKTTRDILAKKGDILRCFDNVEIVQSRKELVDRRHQLQGLKIEERHKDQMIHALSQSLKDSIENEPKQAEKIKELSNQIRDNQDKFTESSDVLNKLMRKLVYMPFDRSGSDPYEYGKETQNLVEINISMIHKLNNLSISLEGYGVRERKREKETEYFEKMLRNSSEEIFEEISKLKELVSKMLSRRKKSNSEETFKKPGIDKEKNRLKADNFNTFNKAKILEESDDEGNEFLEGQLISSYTQNREMRDECKELIQLMMQLILKENNNSKSKINGIVIEILIGLNDYLKNKLNALLHSSEISTAKEVQLDDTVENLENQLTVNFEQISGEIRSLIVQMNGMN